MALTGLALALSACAAGVPTPTVSPPPTVAPTPALDVASLDPCSLFDAGELSTLLSASLRGERADDLDGYHVCRYDDPAASTSLSVLVATEPFPAGRGEDMVDQLPQDGLAEELHGVGEAAWFDYCPACPDIGSTTLTVIEPPLELTLALTLPATDMMRRIPLEELARDVIANLGL